MLRTTVVVFTGLGYVQHFAAAKEIRLKLLTA